MDIYCVAFVQFDCCGANNYQDWADIDWYKGINNPDDREVVPASCCVTVGACGNYSDIIFADDIRNQTVSVWSEVCLPSCSLYVC